MCDFDPKKVIDDCAAWIRAFFDENGRGCPAVLGISGGKDSTVAAALCVRALGRERVIGVLMPNGVQPDIDSARLAVDTLEIRSFEINISGMFESALRELAERNIELTEQARINLAPRLRMSALYAVSQCFDGRVVNTCNLSEDWVGYSTRYGDAAGDLAPLSDLTVTEIRAVGAALGLPRELVEKTPSDGLSGMSDEDKLGFSYDVLDKYIRTGEIDDLKIKRKIDELHERNLFKLRPMPSYRRI